MDQKNQKPDQNQQGDKGKSDGKPDHDAQQRQQNEGGAQQKGDSKSSDTPRQPK